MSVLQFPSSTEKILPDAIKLVWPPTELQNPAAIEAISGSLVGLAIGDALGASVEFRPQEYLIAHPVRDMKSGGTWGLPAGKWTDDTAMALCLASSLITQKGFNPYDQMVRYKWWYKHGYLSSTGYCFDIGNATRDALEEFNHRQKKLKRYVNCRTESEVDQLSFDIIQRAGFNVNCSRPGVAGNGALMRFAPVPLFFYRTPSLAVELSGESARLTHGDDIAIDACRYYGALIVAAIYGERKETLLSKQFYHQYREWFDRRELHSEILRVADGSFKRLGGYYDGIRSTGYVVNTLEAALWAFWSANSFEEGALNAVNLGGDTDTVAATYGQLAGAYYGYRNIPEAWKRKLYANKLINCIAAWLQVLGRSDINSSEQRLSRSITSPIQLPQPMYMNIPQSRKVESTISEPPQRDPHKKRSRSIPRHPRSGISYWAHLNSRYSGDRKT
ncbi:unnamed protein product [Rotaria sordida]|uniref:ADP-ribosylglycohydrolase n=1 Tax=Rotaria sordida TaxID=392033 RepID=A0A815D7S2_9BILA|nr:unnamed protein product [Rotaria sordida]CAF1566480.1 unnamed protein product [Rotaria sordida]